MINPTPEEVNSAFVRTLIATLERENYDLRMRYRNLRIEMDELRNQQPYYYQAIEAERNDLAVRLACERTIKQATREVGRTLFWSAIIGPVVAFLLGLWLGRL